MPSGFVFRLDPLLRVRRHVEGERRRAMAVVDRRRLDLENRIRALQQRLAADREDLRARLSGTIDAPFIRAQATAAIHLESQMRQLALELAQVYRQADRARADLLVASKARKTLERLREIHFERWRTDQNRRESAQLDDLVTARAGIPGGDS